MATEAEKHRHQRRYLLLVMISLSFVVTAILAVTPIQLQQLAEEWWQWIMSIPRESNPQYDKTGDLVERANQHNEVFFVAGAYNQTVPPVRTIEIEQGRPLFFPVIVGGYAYTPDWFTRVIDTITAANIYDKLLAANHIHLIDQTRDLHATLDGEQLPWHRITTVPYDVHYIAGNHYNVTPGVHSTVVDGYWVYLDTSELKLGNHTLIFGGHSPPDYFTTLVYNLVISEKEVD